MGGFLVGDGGFLGAVDFDEEEVGGVGVVLEDVEAGDAGFEDAVGRVFDRGGLEGIDVGGVDVDVDVDDEHDVELQKLHVELMASRSRYQSGENC